MTLIISLAFIAVCLAVAASKSCKSEDKCGEGECCVSSDNNNLHKRGRCIKLGRNRAKCSSPAAKLDNYGGKFVRYCPCQEGMECDTGRIENRCGRCKRPATEKPDESEEKPDESVESDESEEKPDESEEKPEELEKPHKLIAVAASKRCKSEDKCGEGECCVSSDNHNLHRRGRCIKLGRNRARCNSPASKLDSYGGKFVKYCPCQEGMECDTGRIENGFGRCKRPATEKPNESVESDESEEKPEEPEEKPDESDESEEKPKESEEKSEELEETKVHHK